MKVKLSTKTNKLLMSLGTVALVAGLSVNSGMVHADTTSDSQATTDQTQLNAHKDLQAYNNPLTAQQVTTTVGQLPAPQAGVANWSSLPAGTTAVWNMDPDIDKAGISYGQIIVSFPDGSASALAVYVNTTGTDASNIQNTGKTDDAKNETVTDNNNIDTKGSNQAAVTTTSDSANKDTKVAKSTTNQDSEEPVTVSTVSQGDGQVITKDNTNIAESIAPKTEGAVIENETSHVAGDGALPQTNSKSSILGVISGAMLAILGLVGLVTVKERKN